MRTIDAIVSEYDLRAQRFSYINEQAERILGHPPEAFENDGWKSLVDDEDAAAIESLIGQALEDRKDYTYEHRIRAAGGRLVWLRVNASVVRRRSAGS